MGSGFQIEFKYPVGPSGEWRAFSAKAGEVLTDVWEVHSFLSSDGLVFPLPGILLVRSVRGWKERDSNKETLLAALIGKAIDIAAKR